MKIPHLLEKTSTERERGVQWNATSRRDGKERNEVIASDRNDWDLTDARDRSCYIQTFLRV